MGVFKDNAITDSGRWLLSHIEMGAIFVPTKIVMGSGMLPAGTTTRTIKDVVSPEKILPITKRRRGNDGTVTVGGMYTNQDVTTDFYFRELALYARADNLDGSVAAEECLYSYGNAGSTADLMPAYSSGQPVEREIDIVAIIGNDAKVDLTIESGTNMSVKMAQEMAIGIGWSQSFPLTIPAAGWAETEETPYKYTLDIALDAAKEAHTPAVDIHKASMAIAEAAGIGSFSQTLDGVVRLWSRKIPAEDMTATLTLTLPGTGDLSVIAMPTTSEGG